MSALDTFRRAMRRHEKRARRMGSRTVADILRGIRLRKGDDSDHLVGMAKSRRGNNLDGNRRAAFLYERAADAVARYRDALRREEQTWEDYSYVCHECYCVGPDPHAPGCQEAIRELPFGPDDEDDDFACIDCGSREDPCDCDHNEFWET